MAKGALTIERVERLLDGWLPVDRLRLRHGRFEGGWTPPLERTVVRRGPAVVVLPYDPVADTVVLIEQFRAGAVADPVDAWLIEAVAGLIDKDLGPEAIARAELQEEAGLEARDLVQVYEGYSSPGYSDEYIYGFVAHCADLAVAGHHGLDHESEDIRPFRLGFDEAMAMWRAGGIRNLPAQLVLLALAAERTALRARWG
ncbi:MAG: NUDIX domain-containing protein [Pseudomonadota bacterium]